MSDIQINRREALGAAVDWEVSAGRLADWRARHSARFAVQP